ncbi:SprT family zinc-dependent metalloprotease [Candidatus Accumulibacter sp. ACC003]|uniref:M48 family metallopeptidase n=1 Tax=Candidatus Accumulibacter sp. ACC003 TaxID=2823334 RepID=UPI0025BA01D2|nr:SprT family zinc-dependent metalloprotease [Candidatus Accumulibacter sp. ACC003]
MPRLFEQLGFGERPPATGETSRSIAIGERTVPYVLRRGKRQTIGLSIDHRGLRVGAPPRASLREVETLLLKHGQWIGRKLDEWSGRQPPETLQITDGLALPLLGQALTIHLAAGANRYVWTRLAEQPALTLCLRAPTDAPRLLEKALRERARVLFGERLALYAQRLGVELPRLSLSAARTRWGSCSLRSGIRLNWRLIHFPPAVVDYVVAHELAHLREMNHGPRFWAIVAQLYPDHRAARQELRRLAVDCPRW